MRIPRSSLLEVLREDYIRTARAKGQSGRVVVWRHALKNAMLPVVTVIGIEFAFLIGGLVVTETVFNLPGVARFLVQAILWRDYPIVQNLVMFIAIVVILSNLLVDMLYGVLDPRVRYGGYAGLDRRRLHADGLGARGNHRAFVRLSRRQDRPRDPAGAGHPAGAAVARAGSGDVGRPRARAPQCDHRHLDPDHPPGGPRDPLERAVDPRDAIRRGGARARRPAPEDRVPPHPA